MLIRTGCGSPTKNKPQKRRTSSENTAGRPACAVAAAASWCPTSDATNKTPDSNARAPTHAGRLTHGVTKERDGKGGREEGSGRGAGGKMEGRKGDRGGAVVYVVAGKIVPASNWTPFPLDFITKLTTLKTTNNNQNNNNTEREQQQWEQQQSQQQQRA